MTEPLAETGLQSVVRRSADMRVHRQDAPVRERAIIYDSEGQIHASRRVVVEIDVVDDLLVVRTLAVDVIGFNGHRRAKLSLEPDGRLPRVWEVHELGRADEFLNVAYQTSRRPVV